VLALLVDLAKINQFVVTPLGPASWRTIDFSRKDGYGSRDGDIQRDEIIGVVHPAEPG
jgi:hypothetical protein